MIGALVLVMTGFGLGWINIAADWSRYQRRDASGSSIVLWNTVGGALAPVMLVIYGLLLAGSDEKLSAGIQSDPVGTLATILPTWFLVPFLIAAILALVSGAVLGIYSSGLTLLSLGVRIPRPRAALIDGVILTVGTIYVVFFADSFINPFQSFLITLGVPLASWAGIMIADIVARRRDYDEEALFDVRGVYGAWDWTSIGILVATSVVGWGLVINLFADDASWNNWQGYLLGPLGLGGKDGDWAYANLGVLVALVLSFVLALCCAAAPCVARRPAHERTPLAGGDRPPARLRRPLERLVRPSVCRGRGQRRPARRPFGDRSVFTRFVAPAEPTGAWVPYYEEFPWALQPADSRLYELTEDVAAYARTRWWPRRSASGTRTCARWSASSRRSSWPGWRPTAACLDRAGRGRRRCVGHRGDRRLCRLDRCNHQKALDVMALYAPLVTLTTTDDVLAAGQ